MEGDRDAAFFRWFLDHVPGSRGAVYHINTVHIPPDAVGAVGLASEGNRGRVVALALTLDHALPAECHSVYGCVDRDFHGMGFELPKCRFLIYTDHACLECYALSANPISKLFSVYLGTPLRGVEAESMMVVLRHVFLARLARRKMAPNAGWFEQFTRWCSIKDGVVVLDKSEFLSRVLSVAAGTLTASAVETEVKRLASLQACQSYHAANGRDTCN